MHARPVRTPSHLVSATPWKREYQPHTSDNLFKSSLRRCTSRILGRSVRFASGSGEIGTRHVRRIFLWRHRPKGARARAPPDGRGHQDPKDDRGEVTRVRVAGADFRRHGTALVLLAPGRSFFVSTRPCMRAETASAGPLPRRNVPPWTRIHLPDPLRSLPPLL